ncbi:O-antigen ligase family protein [bacterium]|jgi:hypothetical protein|nr:O-antigen ligase family protein [bacterium]MBT4649181.1 O-antigen ligase family protein [bacterium]
MLEILAIICLGGFLLIAKRSVVWALALIILLLPSYLWRLDFLGWPTTFLELMIVGLFIFWLIKQQRRQKINWRLSGFANRIAKPWRYFILTWLLVSVIALIFNFNLSALGLWRAYFLEPILFLLIFLYSVKNKEDRQIIFYGLGGLVVWLAFVAIWQSFTAWNLPAAYNEPNIKRLTAVFAYPNALSLLIAPITAWFTGLWLSSKHKSKELAYLGVIFLGILLLVSTKSEGALLAFGFSLLFYFFFAKIANKKKLALVIILILAIFLTPAKNYITQATNDILQPNSNQHTSSLAVRSLQWQETTELLQDHWLVGAGINGYQKMMVNYHQITWLEIFLYPHNIFLNFWVELGFLGLLLFITLMSYLARTCYGLIKNQHYLAWALTLAWLTWFVHGLVDVPYFKNDLSVLFFILLGLTILAVRDNKSNSRLL